jgi:hypothetical protein
MHGSNGDRSPYRTLVVYERRSIAWRKNIETIGGIYW